MPDMRDINSRDFAPYSPEEVSARREALMREIQKNPVPGISDTTATPLTPLRELQVDITHRLEWALQMRERLASLLEQLGGSQAQVGGQHQEVTAPAPPVDGVIPGMLQEVERLRGAQQDALEIIERLEQL